jgi:hypothetical protein
LKQSAVERRFDVGTHGFGPHPPPPPRPSPPAHRRILSGASAARPLPVSSPSDETDYTGRTRWVYQELRDRKVALFLDKLPQGVWEIRYDLRAEVPGRFHALPVVGQAMYVPEIRANSSEIRMTVTEAE